MDQDLPQDPPQLAPQPQVLADNEAARGAILKGLYGLFAPDPIKNQLEKPWPQPLTQAQLTGPPGKVGPGDMTIPNMVLGGLMGASNFVGGGEGAAAAGMAHMAPAAFGFGAAAKKLAPKASSEDAVKTALEAVNAALGYSEKKLIVTPKDSPKWSNITPELVAQQLAKAHTMGPDVFNKAVMIIPTDLWSKVKPLVTKYTDAEDVDVTHLIGADISEQGISKALEKDPGASIADIAKLKTADWQFKTNAVLSKADENADRAKKIAKYEKHLQPIDWQTAEPHWRAEDQGALTPMTSDFNVPAQHLQSTGFNTNFFLYKGGRDVNAVPDPAKKQYERGIFYADNPEVASMYSAHHIGQYVARAPKAFEVNWKNATGATHYDDAHMTPMIEAARNKGADLLVLRGLHDMGGSQDQYVVLNPSIVRKPEAQFDPSKLHLNNLLAGLGGFGVAAPAAASLMQGGQGEQ